jgi:hypothetical protein
MFGMHDISLQNHGTGVTHTNSVQKFGFRLNQINDGEDATKLSIAKDDWVQLKGGVPFQEYVSCGNEVVMCEVYTLEQTMDVKFTSDVSEEEGGKGR